MPNSETGITGKERPLCASFSPKCYIGRETVRTHRYSPTVKREKRRSREGYLPTNSRERHIQGGIPHQEVYPGWERGIYRSIPWGRREVYIQGYTLGCVTVRYTQGVTVRYTQGVKGVYRGVRGVYPGVRGVYPGCVTGVYTQGV